MHKTHRYEKGMFANKDNTENTTRFFCKNILKQFNFQQNHIKFIFLSVSLQKIETYSNGIYKCTYIG